MTKFVTVFLCWQQIELQSNLWCRGMHSIKQLYYCPMTMEVPLAKKIVPLYLTLLHGLIDLDESSIVVCAVQCFKNLSEFYARYSDLCETCKIGTCVIYYLVIA